MQGSDHACQTCCKWLLRGVLRRTGERPGGQDNGRSGVANVLRKGLRQRRNNLLDNVLRRAIEGWGRVATVRGVEIGVGGLLGSDGWVLWACRLQRPRSLGGAQPSAHPFRRTAEWVSLTLAARLRVSDVWRRCVSAVASVDLS